jgi:uncharacterized protein (TIGR02285 family)
MPLRRLAAGLALLATAALAMAQDPPRLRWLVQDVPPYFSYLGSRAPSRPEELGQGEVDGFLRLLIQRLPDYRHEFVEASTPRYESWSRQGETLCSVLHVRRPERLDWLHFTPLHPALQARQIHIIVRKEALPRFEQDGQALQLAELLQRRDLVGLLPRDRSFGPRIDSLLAEQGPRGPRTIAVTRNTQLLAMLRAKRMDYTLEYPSVVQEFLRQQGGPADLVRLPLAEGRSTQLATASCSRTPEGRQLIEVIDLAMRQLAQDPQRERLLRSWRGSAMDEAEQQKLLRYLDERARGGPQIE